MDELRRLYVRIAQSPRTVAFEDLIKLMTLAGFEHRLTRKGDNVLFTHSVYDVQEAAGKPHHGSVPIHYVRKCLRAIEDVWLKEEKCDA